MNFDDVCDEISLIRQTPVDKLTPADYDRFSMLMVMHDQMKPENPDER